MEMFVLKVEAVPNITGCIKYFAPTLRIFGEVPATNFRQVFIPSLIKAIISLTYTHKPFSGVVVQ